MCRGLGWQANKAMQPTSAPSGARDSAAKTLDAHMVVRKMRIWSVLVLLVAAFAGVFLAVAEASMLLQLFAFEPFDPEIRASPGFATLMIFDQLRRTAWHSFVFVAGLLLSFPKMAAPPRALAGAIAGLACGLIHGLAPVIAILGWELVLMLPVHAALAGFLVGAASGRSVKSGRVAPN